MLKTVDDIAAMMVAALKKVIVCILFVVAHSAADAQLTLAAEFSGRFILTAMRCLQGVALQYLSYLTAVGNDYSYDVIYARLIKGIGNSGDVLVGLSASVIQPTLSKRLKLAREKESLR